jgi:hypothetical protein
LSRGKQKSYFCSDSLTKYSKANGSCEVIAITGDALELGFYSNQKVHMNAIVNEFRPLIEEYASEILGRQVTLKAQLIERPQAGAARRGPRGGHLAEAAKAAGATPVERADKES